MGGVPLSAPWHNWPTVQCHLTLFFQCPPPLPLQLPSSLPKGVEGHAVFLRCWFGGSNSPFFFPARPLKAAAVRTELRISGSGSVNVGDRGIWGLKPLHLPLHKSCFIAYTSALANMLCIVTGLPAG